MPVKLTFQDNVQIVIIKGVLSAPESAAIRLKLDEKITQGRLFILFDLSGWDFRDALSVSLLIPLLEFCFHRNANPALFGLPKSVWGQFVIKDGRRPECFERQIEAIKWFAELASAEPVTKPEATSPLSDEEIEKQLKAKHLEKLLQDYEVFHLDKKPPELNLSSHLEEYAKLPRKSILREFVRAAREVAELTNTVKELRRLTAVEAEEMLSLMKLRKFPIAANEIKARLAALSDEKNHIEKETVETENRIRTLLAEMKDFEKGEKAFRAESEQRVRLAEEKLRKREMEVSEKIREKAAGGSGTPPSS